MALLEPNRRGRPNDAELRSAMSTWAYIPTRRTATAPPAAVRTAALWLPNGTRPLPDLNDTALLRQVLDALSKRQDGSVAAANTIVRKRAVFYNVLDFAVEREVFPANPLTRVRWKAPRVSEGFDPRAVINPTQARALLAATREVGADGPRATPTQRALRWHGRHLTAFFALLYYAALRPSEAMALRREDLRLPDGDGWGQLLLSRSDPDVSATWTDEGRRTVRHLKHRAQGQVRTVPAPPALVTILRQHLNEYGTGLDGRLIRGVREGRITAGVYNGVWQAARRAALTAAESDSPLAARPYDLRHTAVSSWLAAGVDSTQVAVWAGHSVAVLHRVYSHVVGNREDLAHRRIDDFLRDEM